MAVRLVIMCGTYVTSQHLSGVVDGTAWKWPRGAWGQRVDRMYEPDEARAAFGWQHEGAGIPFAISALTPNAPVAGDTRITLSSGHLRAVGTWARLRITGTGTDFDGDDVIVAEVTGASELVVRGRVASGSAAAGTCNMGYLSSYHGDTHGSTDDTYGGAFPSTVIGPDYRLVALIQDAIQADSATEDDTLLLVKLAPTTQALRGRDTDQRGRWLPAAEGEGKANGTGTLPDGAFLSCFEDYRHLIRDVRSVLQGIGTANADIHVSCLVLGFGLNDGNLAQASLGRKVHTVTAATVVGGTTLEITTSAPHGVTTTAGKSLPVGILSGLSMDPDGIAGKHYELDVISTTKLRLRNFVPTGTPTLGAAPRIETGDPGFWFEEDLLAQIDAMRQVLDDEFSSVVADDVRTILINCDHAAPNAVHTAARGAVARAPAKRSALSVVDLRDFAKSRAPGAVLTAREPLIDETSLTTTAGSGTALDPPTLSCPAGGLSQYQTGEAIAVQFSGGNLHLAYVTEVVSDTLLKVHHNPTVFGGSEIPFANLTANGIVYRITYPEDPKFYSLDATLKLGEQLAEHALSEAAVVSLEAKRPAIVAVCIGDSYGIGKPVTAYKLDGDPRLLSPDDTPQVGQFVWNETTRQFEVQYLELPNGEHGSGQNINTHRDWNWAQMQAGGGQVGPQAALLRGLRERFPDESVFLLNLAFNGATAGVAAGTLNPKTILSLQVLASSIVVEVAFSSELQVDREVAVTLAGVSGLTPSVNGLHTNATPVPGAGASTFISIPIVTSGTPSIAGATLTVRPASWSPSAGELWDSFENDIVRPAFDWLWANGYVPDVRPVFVMLGYNDAAQGISASFGTAVADIVTSLRALLTTRGKPRDELPIVWLAPILHDELSSERRTAIEACRTALETHAGSDSAFAVLELDQDPDWLEYHAVISEDEIHPTLAGYQQIGYRLARIGLGGIAAFAGDHPVDFTPQVPVGGVTP